MSVAAGLPDSDLPGFFREADAASLTGQAWTLRYTLARLGGSVLAACGSVLSISAGHLDVAALIILVGFAVALGAEVASWVHRPEAAWYEGRALAESAKTLAWRYAVCADPFTADLPARRAGELLRSRFREVSEDTAAHIVVDADEATTTPAMERLRQKPFETRRATYIEGRTLDQQRWYAKKARLNRRLSTCWRIALVLAGVAALIVAALRVFGGWNIDLAGLMAATIAAGAAWVAVKQFAPLASAYTVAARELAFQADRLRNVVEEDWATTVADAEEAISREHTLWLASRTGKAPIK